MVVGKVLIIIPARGGSKGIPQKNLRGLNEKPLIYYSIHTALNSSFSPDVFVTSDNDEILSLAQKFGAISLKRPKAIADDITTLDPVIFHAFQIAEEKTATKYDVIVTLQPTSPLLTPYSLDVGIRKILEEDYDTILSVMNDTHLTWSIINGELTPNYEKRVNRQQLTPVYRETGGFLICKRKAINKESRIGKKVGFVELHGKEAIDIDNYEDWNLCEYYLKKKHIVFVVSGYKEIGLGHVYNALSIANEILSHELTFVVDDKSDLAQKKIEAANYKVVMQESEDIAEDVLNLYPDIVINDMLDTNISYVKRLKKAGKCVINFEDLGAGAKLADLVINAMYPERAGKHKGHYFGEKYFCLKDEFIFTQPKKLSERVNRILISFGGVDPNNYTAKVLSAIYDYCVENNIHIDIVAGMGYTMYESLKKFAEANIVRNVSNISEYMKKADLVFTSAGRTTFEVASIGTPCIVMAQNKREQTHFFCNKENGFINLGLGTKVGKQQLKDVFMKLVSEFELREKMCRKMKKADLKNGKQRVLKLINEAINHHII